MSLFGYQITIQSNTILGVASFSKTLTEKLLVTLVHAFAFKSCQQLIEKAFIEDSKFKQIQMNTATINIASIALTSVSQEEKIRNKLITTI